MWLGDSAEVAQTVAEEVQHFEESTQVRLGEGLGAVSGWHKHYSRKCRLLTSL